ncbi:minor capsid protein [Clostridium formicaceticum]|uniref:Phage Mu protein F like protein n=1 Tax=Clostridium formicaceticum TaxID=1497 RepID=A0AAC9RK88_9CLOT|nr:minor capsid protein [Clostridium formicaceticum]AOY76737.1 hypothetical protein BJL90_13185 [Clostridium formicaceticum]ARE87174.1 Phage Mu protein F like protein [Clostridium formicaceticum]
MSRHGEIIEIKQAMIQRTEEQEKKLQIEHRKILRLLLLMLLEFYHHYSVDGKLIINRYQRESFMVQVEKLLLEKVGAMAALEKNILENLLNEIYEDTYIKHSDLLDGSSPLPLNPNLINDHIHQKFKEDTFGNRIHRNKQELVTKLYHLINTGIKEGRDYQQLTKEIDKAFQYSGYQSKRLMMTEESRIFNLSQRTAFKVMDYKGKIMWCSVLCHTTCDYCQSMHGETFYIEDDNLPDMPAHANCQCFWVPV